MVKIAPSVTSIEKTIGRKFFVEFQTKTPNTPAARRISYSERKTRYIVIIWYKNFELNRNRKLPQIRTLGNGKTKQEVLERVSESVTCRGLKEGNKSNPTSNRICRKIKLVRLTPRLEGWTYSRSSATAATEKGTNKNNERLKGRLAVELDEIEMKTKTKKMEKRASTYTPKTLLAKIVLVFTIFFRIIILNYETARSESEEKL